MKEKLASRKLWMALLAGGLAFCNSFFNMGLSRDEMSQIMLPLLGFIGVEGAVDAVRMFRS